MSYLQLSFLLQTGINNQLSGSSIIISIFPFPHLSHRYRRGHGFKSRTSLNFFFFQVLLQMLVQQCLQLRGSLIFRFLTVVHIYDFHISTIITFWVVASRLTLRRNLLFTAKSSGNKRTTEIPIVALLVTYLYYSVTIFKYISMQSPHIIGQPLIVQGSLSKTDSCFWDIEATRQNPDSVQTTIVS